MIYFLAFLKEEVVKLKKKQPKKGSKIKSKISIRHIAKWDKKKQDRIKKNNGFQVLYCIRTNVSDLYSKTTFQNH